MIMRAQPYSGVLVRGSRRPVLNVMRRRRGLGDCMSGSDFYAAIGYGQNCDPRDSACVMCNTQRSNAVNNLVDSGCVAPGTPISFSCDTSNSALNSFMNNAPLAVNATVGTGATAYVASGPTVTPSNGTFVQATQQQQSNPVAQQTTVTSTTPPYQPLPPQPAAPTVINPTPASQSTMTGSSVTSPNSTNSQANGSWLSDSTQDVISGFPNWGLLVAGGVLLFMMMHSGRR